MKYLTVNEVAEKFKIDRTTVYNWLHKGCPALKIGGSRRFIESEIEEWVKKIGVEEYIEKIRQDIIEDKEV